MLLQLLISILSTTCITPICHNDTYCTNAAIIVVPTRAGRPRAEGPPAAPTCL